MAKKKVEPQETLLPSKTLGEMLKEARIKQGLTLEEVNKKIKLRPIILEHLENNEFELEDYPSNFMRGYIRSYAKFLSLPESDYQETIDNLKDTHTTLKQDTSACTLESESHYGRWIYKISALIVLALLVTSAFYWWENYQYQTQERENLVSHYEEMQTQKAVDSMVFLPELDSETPMLVPGKTMEEATLETAPLTETPLP